MPLCIAPDWLGMADGIPFWMYETERSHTSSGYPSMTKQASFRSNMNSSRKSRDRIVNYTPCKGVPQLFGFLEITRYPAGFPMRPRSLCKVTVKN